MNVITDVNMNGMLLLEIKSDFVAFDCEFTGLLSCLEKIEGRFPN